MSVSIVFDSPVLTKQEIAFLERLEKRTDVCIIYLRTNKLRLILSLLKIKHLIVMEIFLQKIFKISRDFNLNQDKAFSYRFKSKSMEMYQTSLVINLSSVKIMDKDTKIIGICNDKGGQESLFKVVENAFKAKKDHVSLDIQINDINKRQVRYELEKFFLNDYLNVQSRILFYIEELCDDLL